MFHLLQYKKRPFKIMICSLLLSYTTISAFHCENLTTAMIACLTMWLRIFVHIHDIFAIKHFMKRLYSKGSNYRQSLFAAYNQN